MYKRYLFFRISPYLSHKNALVITGMRQVGKTTLMRQLYDAWTEAKIWFDFDNPLDMLTFENINYKSIYEDLRNMAGAKSSERFLVCIDEIQNFPEITKVIKYLIDHYGVKFIVTGSSNYYLRNLFPESLSGRKFIFEMAPLTYKEYLHFRGFLNAEQTAPDLEVTLRERSPASIYEYSDYFNDYLTYGGFPEVTLTKDAQTKNLILKNIFASFFEKDIKIFSELKDIRELRDLILLLGPRSGNIIDITRLASDLGVNRVKIYNYLEFLVGTYFIRMLPKYTASIDRSVAGGKKLYFTDTGILNLISKPTEGQLLETAVANLLNHYGQLSFYNKRNTAEIDFVLEKKTAFEVKYKATENDAVKLVKLTQSLGIENSYMVSQKPVESDKVIYPWFI